MNNQINFEGCVKESTVKTNKDGLPVTVVVIEVEGYEPRIGSYVNKDKARFSVNG